MKALDLVIEILAVLFEALILFGFAAFCFDSVAKWRGWYDYSGAYRGPGSKHVNKLLNLFKKP